MKRSRGFRRRATRRRSNATVESTRWKIRVEEKSPMPFFCNEDLSLHYVERGQGEPLVLIHGLGCCGAAWAFQVAALEKRFRVIVPDLPGSGHTPPPPAPSTIPPSPSA